MIMRTGDKVLISPDLTHAKDWTQGEVIEVENNPFVGIVISAKTADGNIFFGYKEFLDYLLQTLLDYKYIVYLSMPKETDSKDLHFIRSFRLIYL